MKNISSLVLFVIVASVVFSLAACSSKQISGDQISTMLSGKVVNITNTKNNHVYKEYIGNDGTWFSKTPSGQGEWMVNDLGQFCQTNVIPYVNEGCVTLEEKDNKFISYSGNVRKPDNIRIWTIGKSFDEIEYHRLKALAAKPAAGQGGRSEYYSSWGGWSQPLERREAHPFKKLPFKKY